MTRVRVLYWKEIPVQIQAEDENDRVSRPLEDRFQEAIDRIAMFDGSAGSDDYLESWSWSEYRNVAGGAQQAAEALAERYNRAFPQNFESKIKRLHRSGRRRPFPGALDQWLTQAGE